MSPRRNLKPREDGTRKAVELSKAVISLKIPNTRLQKLSSKPFIPVEQQVEKLTASMQGVEENNKRYQENPQLYRTRKRLTNIYSVL
jgi:hypothetical protein